jgi:hypothetical protein
MRNLFRAGKFRNSKVFVIVLGENDIMLAYLINLNASRNYDLGMFS